MFLSFAARRGVHDISLLFIEPHPVKLLFCLCRYPESAASRRYSCQLIGLTPFFSRNALHCEK